MQEFGKHSKSLLSSCCCGFALRRVPDHDNAPAVAAVAHVFVVGTGHTTVEELRKIGFLQFLTVPFGGAGDLLAKVVGVAIFSGTPFVDIGFEDEILVETVSPNGGRRPRSFHSRGIFVFFLLAGGTLSACFASISAT